MYRSPITGKLEEEDASMVSPDAAQLAQEHRLGEPLSEYRASPTGFLLCLGCILGTLLMLLAAMVITLIGILRPDFLLTAILPGTLVAIALFALYTWRADVPNLQRRILMCTEGFLHIQPRSKEPKIGIFRWDQIASVEYRLQRGTPTTTTSGQYRPTFIYTVTRNDGLSVQWGEAPFAKGAELGLRIAQEVTAYKQRHANNGGDAP
jgi:hypothetical protein